MNADTPLPFPMPKTADQLRASLECVAGASTEIGVNLILGSTIAATLISILEELQKFNVMVEEEYR